ncbi:MAG: monovalent cation/H+ antiporter subunit D family protein [Pseudomonadota bacterium]
MTVLAHLPALQVVAPLLAAPVCVIIRSPRLAWAIACAVSWLTFFTACGLLWQVQTNGPISYALGGWAHPWGIEYRVDHLNAIVLLVVSGISTLVLPFARDSIEREVPKSRLSYLYAGWILCLTGLLGMAITGDAFNVFVFLEISSLSTYMLVALGPDRRALMSAFEYLIIGTIGATFILIGIGLMYQLTGTLNMADLAERLPSPSENRTVVAAIGFTLVGIAIKAAVFPLHVWLPRAYRFAPVAVTAFLAGSATKVSVYLLARFAFSVFGIEWSVGGFAITDLFLVIALAGSIVASLIAIYANDLKALLAYSSVAQIAYMVLGLSLANAAGISAAMIHLFNHALMKTALFMVVGCVVFRTGRAEISNLAGLGRLMPWTMAAFVLAGLSLIGVPLTAGFISKWYLILAAIERDLMLVVVLIIISSLMAVIYIWRVVEVAYFREPEAGFAGVREAPWSMLGPLWLLVLANIYFGIDPEIVTTTANAAAAMLLGGGGS